MRHEQTWACPRADIRGPAVAITSVAPSRTMTGRPAGSRCWPRAARPGSVGLTRFRLSLGIGTDRDGAASPPCTLASVRGTRLANTLTWLTLERRSPHEYNVNHGGDLTAGSDRASGFMLEFHAEPDSVQAAFLRRAVAAVEHIAETASAKTLTAALAAPTGVGSLAQLLSRSEVVRSAGTDLDPLAPALARNVEHRERLLGARRWHGFRRGSRAVAWRDSGATGHRQAAAGEHVAGSAGRE